MVDVVSPDVRSRMMAGIGGKNTKPERVIRQGLHALGFRFLIHDRRLPGKPDIVLSKWKSVIFVNGCFWHGHDCHLFKLPSTRTEFWKEKIEANRSNDARVLSELIHLNWRVATAWECALKGRSRLPVETILADLSDWLKSEGLKVSIRGTII
jgi:DNA mismatch endonuclease (patch repair protein)